MKEDVIDDDITLSSKSDLNVQSDVKDTAHNLLALQIEQDSGWSKVYCCIWKMQNKGFVKASSKNFKINFKANSKHS